MRAYKLLLVVGAIALVLAIQLYLRVDSESIAVTTPTPIPTSAPTVAGNNDYFRQLTEHYNSELENAAYDPTWDEMIAFLNSNKVNWQGYGENYDCLNFACDLQREAFEQGIRCAVVLIDFSTGGHAIVAFDTTDRGLIYIEPQADLPTKVEVGMRYWLWLYDPGYNVGHDDTVTSIELNWDLSFCGFVTS